MRVFFERDYANVRDCRGALMVTPMNKEIARNLLLLGKSFDPTIARVFAEIDKIEDEQIKSQFKRAVGDIMGYVARDLIFPIENMFPDLKADPDERQV